jgi:hypothetical protein
MYWVAFGLMVVPTILGIGWVIFRSWAGFREAVWYEFLPDLISMFRGELKRDWMAEMKLGIFIILGLVAASYEKVLLDWLIARWSQ